MSYMCRLFWYLNSYIFLYSFIELITLNANSPLKHDTLILNFIWRKPKEKKERKSEKKVKNEKAHEILCKKKYTIDNKNIAIFQKLKWNYFSPNNSLFLHI
jgi:hypothetical protein